ncbi:MAG: CPBP family intramembrane metalloprotease [Bacteroidetes bacterium]|nr:CPBP family intramembrane metalloprotease [Bacteroidota bacterium]
MRLTKRRIYILTLITLFGMGGLGIVLIKFFGDSSFKEILGEGRSLSGQLAIGVAYGIIVATLLTFALDRPPLNKVQDFFGDLLEDVHLNYFDVIWFSLCAGIGEEILFRAAIQPHFGIWPTAIVFILLHGYINPFRLSLSIYGVLLIIVSAGLGYLYAYFGLVCAITAHFMIDVILFRKIR